MYSDRGTGVGVESFWTWKVEEVHSLHCRRHIIWMAGFDTPVDRSCAILIVFVLAMATIWIPAWR